MSKLHPTTSLYEDVTDEVKVEEYFNKRKKKQLIKVCSALKLNQTALRELESQALKYEVDDNNQINENSINYKEFMNYVNDSYKNKVISKLLIFFYNIFIV